MSRRAILLSGGQDSVALLHWLHHDVAITIDYGQNCACAEREASAAVAYDLQVDHYILNVDCSEIGSGDLSGRCALDVAPESEWWPFRNQLLITIAAAKCLSLDVSELHIATVSDDGFHCDGTNEFFDMMNALLQSQEGGLRVIAPAIDMTSVELVRKSGVSRELMAWCHSCHKYNVACGKCRGCLKHFGVLDQLGWLSNATS